MQRPTCTGLRVRSTYDAHVIFHAVALGELPIVSRRLDTEERRAIGSGCVYVWEERGSNTESTGLGIERWTDSIRWGPSRVKDEFLFYHEKDPDPAELAELASDTSSSDSATLPSRPGFSPRPFRDNLIKQTYSVYVDTRRGRRKWHLIAYFTNESLDYLRSIDDIPKLSRVYVPPGKYKSARSGKNNNKRSPAQLTYNRAIDPSAYRVVNQPPAQIGADKSTGLAPLAYLQNIAPPRRHPSDEEALMMFSLRALVA